MKKRNITFAAGVLCLSFVLLGCEQSDKPVTHQTTFSKDQTIISYDVYGAGETTLIFVHGWSCDSRYWQYQVPYFAQKYQVVTVDLAGHGHSGTKRTDYTMPAFGEDIRAVVDQLKAKQCILIGHSMGGTVIAEAANILPQRVVGLIGVDTLQDVTNRLTQDEYQAFVEPLKANFQNHTPKFVRSMMIEDTDPHLVDWVSNDMSAAPPAVALSAIEHLFGLYMRGQASEPFRSLTIPVWALNADFWDTDIAANRTVMPQFDAVIMKNCGHFLMLEKPEEFNRRLEAIISKIIRKGPQ